MPCDMEGKQFSCVSKTSSSVPRPKQQQRGQHIKTKMKRVEEETIKNTEIDLDVVHEKFLTGFSQKSVTWF